MKKNILLKLSISILFTNTIIAQSNEYPTSGDVTIRNYSPQVVLQRNTDYGGFTSGIQTRLENGTDNWFFGNLHTDSWIVSKGNYQNAKLTVLSNGNVGIGTGNPLSKLNVVNAYYSGTPTKANSAAFFDNQGTGVYIGGNEYLYGYIQAEQTDIVLTKNLVLQPNGGNVGIGTTSPNSTLQIGDSNNSGSPSTEIEIKRLSLAPVTHSGSDWFFTTRDNNPYANLDIGYSNNKALTIRHDGNIGIGLTNPSNKLDVNGTIHSKEVKVDMSGWSDFVFKKEYTLPTLEEVEKQINEKGHLANIPSEEEVLKNGINLGEMNAKLLQKIEELTLYTIQQNKNNLELKQKIEKLEKENEAFKTLSKRLSEIEKIIK